MLLNVIFKNKVSKETFWALCAKIMSIAGGLFVLIVVPKVAGVETFGNFSLILAYISIFGIFSGVPINHAIKKEVTEGKWNAISKRYVIAAVKLKIINLSIAFFFMLAIIRIFQLQVLKDNLFYFLLLMMTENFWGLIISVFESVHRLVYETLLYLIEYVTKTAAIIICIFFFGLTVKTVLFSFFLAYLCAFIVGAALVIKNYNGVQKEDLISPDAAIVKQLVPRTFFLTLAGLSSVVLAKIDIVMISWYLSVDFVGFYSVASDIVKNAVILSTPYIIGVVPLFVSCQEPQKVFFRSLKVVFTINAIIFVVVFFCSDFLIAFVYGREFERAAMVMKILAFYPLCMAIQILLQKILILHDKTRHIFLLGLFAVILNISLNAALIPVYEINGAAIATIVSFIAWNMVSIVSVRKVLKKENEHTNSLL